jgi:dTMP kinase
MNLQTINPDNSTGVFITFEGGEGVGKSTQIRLLEARLIAAGYQVLCLREPGGTPIGEQVRRVLLQPQNAAMDARTELLLYEACRAQLVHEVIRPALKDGKVVLCDRFTDSTLAYQGAARGLSLERVERANEVATGGLAPVRTVLLERDTARALAKATEDGADRLEAEGLAFHEQVNAAFEQIAQGDPARVRTVRCQADKAATATLVYAAVADLFVPKAAEFTITAAVITAAKERE